MATLFGTALPAVESLPFDHPAGNWSYTNRGGSLTADPLHPGMFAPTAWLTADFFNPHDVLQQWRLDFLTAEGIRRGEIIFALYPRIRARLRIPGTALNQNSWLLPREGALLKPMCGGDVVRPEEVVALQLHLLAGPEGPVRCWRSPWQVTPTAPPQLERAESADARVLDALGQRAVHTWEGKTPDAATLISQLKQCAAQSTTIVAAPGCTRWGGSSHLRFESTGFFRTQHDGRRWWLVDPDGGAFWSTGICCVTPVVEAAIGGLQHLLAWTPDDTPEWADARLFRAHGIHAGPGINFLAANFIRAFGAARWREEWRSLTAAFLRRHRFNTIGNWSDWELGRQAGIPYTRPLSDLKNLRLPMVFRDFPDVFDPVFESEAARWAEQLRGTSGDPAFLGYFICNEPEWAFARQSPTAGMLANTQECASRAAFSAWLRCRHADDAALARAWGDPEATFARVARGHWPHLPQTAAFTADAEAFSTIMASRLFDTVGNACRAVDPHHLNLGARFASPPEPWLLQALGSFDVFSFNSYSKMPRPAGAEISKTLQRPVIIGEWHFGATDSGMPAAALETVASQRDRGLAYRRYVEAHAATPWCVGVHWFTLYDQSALGRFDGEPYNCGFLDVCHQEHRELAQAALKTHERLVAIAAGLEPPDTQLKPDYRPRLSI